MINISLIVKVHQRIKEEKMNIEIVDRLNQIEIQEQVFACLHFVVDIWTGFTAHFYIRKLIEKLINLKKQI